jgi:hypothetical protein
MGSYFEMSPLVWIFLQRGERKVGHTLHSPSPDTLCGSAESFALFRSLEVCCFEIVFFKEIVKIRSVFSGELGCLAHIAFADFEYMDEIPPLIVILGLLERLK